MKSNRGGTAAPWNGDGDTLVLETR